jgi:hypothetical protein
LGVRLYFRSAQPVCQMTGAAPGRTSDAQVPICSSLCGDSRTLCSGNATNFHNPFRRRYSFVFIVLQICCDGGLTACELCYSNVRPRGGVCRGGTLPTERASPDESSRDNPRLSEELFFHSEGNVWKTCRGVAN